MRYTLPCEISSKCGLKMPAHSLKEKLLCLMTPLLSMEKVDDFLMENSNNAVVPELLQVLFKSFYILCECLLVDHLPGGVHDKPIENQNPTLSVSETSHSWIGF